jgi:hypothetical protein
MESMDGQDEEGRKAGRQEGRKAGQMKDGRYVKSRKNIFPILYKL